MTDVDVHKAFYSKASIDLFHFLENVVDIIHNFYCEDMSLDKSTTKMEIYMAFFGSGFLTKNSAEKDRRIQGKGDSLPRKNCVFLDIFF